MAETPTAVKIWLAGGIPLWVAAKIHTMKTMNSGHYIELHWPFWAAIAGWTVLVLLADTIASKLRQQPLPPTSS